MPSPNEPQKRDPETQKTDRSIRILTLVVIAIAAALGLNVLSNRVFAPTNHYNTGVSAMESGDYPAAIEAFAAAGDYKDASDKLSTCRQLYANLLAGKEDALYLYSGNTSLYSIDENGVLSFDKDSYEEASSVLGNVVTLPDVMDDTLVTALKDKAFLNAATVEGVVLPVGVTAIPDSCFYNCTALTVVDFGITPKVTTFGQRCFLSCTSLKEFTVPATVTSIGLRAFNNCYSLEKMNMDACQVEMIMPYTFSECYSLKSISLPGTLTEIKESAFTGCESLTDVYFSGTEEQWNAIVIGEGNEALTTAEVHFSE